MLASVEWEEFELQKLFEKIKTNSLKYKTKDLPDEPIGEFVLPALTAGIQNQGLNNFVPRTNATILKNVVSISANGANTGATFYQKQEFTVLQDAYAIRWKYSAQEPTERQYLYLVACISARIYGRYAWTNKAGWERIKTEKIQLPTKNGQLALDFMENFVAELEVRRTAELEAYLSAAGLKDCTLTTAEQNALADLGNIRWQSFNLKQLFGKATRGKRLKSDDRISGCLPFVTAGEADTGVSAFIGNQVDVFKANTVTIDMFGSAKYRCYQYGGDDHIAVVHTDKLPPLAVLCVTAAIHKASYTGKFHYGHNFYAKDADELNIMLPEKDGKPDYDFMQTLLSAVQKTVIKDVVQYADRKIAATKTVIRKS